MHPKITVLMLVYNGELYIKEAIESILNQTFQDFELLIINDGSSDNSINIINSYKDPRIRILENKENKGLVYSRNRGACEARGQFIAIMDCDDISHQERLEKQVKFLENNPEFALVGSLVQSINQTGKFIGKPWELYASSEKIKAVMLFRNLITNPAAMIKKEIFKELRYEYEYPPAEDFALWLRIIENNKVWNYPDVLLYYRVHGLNISRLKLKQRYEAEKKLLKRQLKELLAEFSEDDLMLHHSISVEGVRFSKNQFNQLIAWLHKLEHANKVIRKYNSQCFMEVLAEEFFNACKGHGTHLGFWIIFKFYKNNPYLKYSKLNFQKHARFVIKSLLQQLKLIA